MSVFRTIEVPKNPGRSPETSVSHGTALGSQRVAGFRSILDIDLTHRSHSGTTPLLSDTLGWWRWEATSRHSNEDNRLLWQVMIGATES